MNFNKRYENLELMLLKIFVEIRIRDPDPGSEIRVFRPDPDPDPNLSKYPDPTGSGSETLLKALMSELTCRFLSPVKILSAQVVSNLTRNTFL